MENNNQRAYIQVEVSIHEALKALEQLVPKYPIERLDKSFAQRLVTLSETICMRISEGK